MRRRILISSAAAAFGLAIVAATTSGAGASGGDDEHETEVTGLLDAHGNPVAPHEVEDASEQVYVTDLSDIDLDEDSEEFREGLRAAGFDPEDN